MAKKKLNQDLLKEKAELEHQRALLRRRFDPDSEDSQGTDPLAIAHLGMDSECSALTTHTVCFLNNFISSTAKEDIEFDDETNSSLAPVIAQFDMESFLNTPQFNAILDQIEHDLNISRCTNN